MPIICKGRSTVSWKMEEWFFHHITCFSTCLQNVYLIFIHCSRAMIHLSIYEPLFVFQMITGLLKHTPSPASSAAASSSASDQNSNAQTTVPTIPRGHLVVGPKDQLRLLTPVGTTTISNHCTVAGVYSTKRSGGGGGSIAPQPSSSLSEEDDGGGGSRVKKKRKKKDKKEREIAGGQGEERGSSKPKKRKEEKVAMTVVVTARKSKEPKKAKERRERRTEGKESRKGSVTEHKNVPGVKMSGAAVASRQAEMPVKVPAKRGRKPKVKILPPVPTNQGKQQQWRGRGWMRACSQVQHISCDNCILN